MYGNGVNKMLKLDLDKGTFGKEKCHIYLVDMLNKQNDKKLSYKISEMVIKVSRHLKELRKCKPDTRSYASILIIKQYESILNDLVNKDPDNKLIYDLTQNVIKIYYKGFHNEKS